MNKYSTEEKQQAIDLYFKNGCNMKKTVRELGYGSATGIFRWLRETVPDKVSSGSHGDRDGGSKCVTTGSICVPKNIMILKSLKVQEKSFQAFLCLLECSRVGERTKVCKLEPPGTLIKPSYLSSMWS